MLQMFYSKRPCENTHVNHSRKKYFQCEVCERKVSHKSHLKRHILTHTKVKAHECDIRKKKFSVKSSLVTHFRIHLGEQPYGCANCEKWFTAIASRDYHLRTHHKELSKEQKSELKCKQFDEHMKIYKSLVK